MTDWRFSDPPNVATVTVRQIMDGHRPILLVSRDEEDGTWQFLTGDDFRVEEALLVSLHTVVELDASLSDIADLDPGWTARRQGPGLPWVRTQA